MPRLHLSCLIGCLCLLLVGPAPAEVIQLSNGDSLTGEVVEQTDEHLVVEHALLGRVTVPRAEVTAVLTPEEAAARAEAAQEEAVEQAKSELAAEAAPEAAGEQADTATATAAEVEPQPQDQGIRIGAVSILKGWERRFEMGASGAEGNSNNFNFRAALNALYEDAEKRWIFDAAYFRASEDGNVSENDFYAELLRDWLLPEKKHFYFATGRYDWDDFQDWEHRLSAAGGIGYQFVQNDDWDVLGRAGLGGNQTFGGTDDEFTPEGLLGINIKWRISEGQSLAFGNTLYPSLSELGEARNLARLEYLIKLNSSKNLALKLGLEDEYQTNPGGNAKRNDLKYYLALVWEF